MKETENYEVYMSPLVSRYAPRSYAQLFSGKKKYTTWRRLWTALAKAQKKSGLPISEQQIKALEANIENIDFAEVAKIEKETRHDVMAHIRAFGKVAPEAAGIIHLGATSAFVTDNTDIILMREALGLVIFQVVEVIRALSKFARKTKSVVTLGYTHFQPAQPITVGKRACLWLTDLLSDVESLQQAGVALRFRGVKGATGTQASLCSLFKGDSKKIKELDRLVAEEFGFDEIEPVTGQTYSRKRDWKVLAALSAVAQSASKFSYDIRLLSNTGEMEEPRGAKQVGSSAMPYKRNPMKCERIGALARFVISTAMNAAMTAATQWLERTLDDSANRRLIIPQSFLATGGFLNTYLNVASGLVVNENAITERLQSYLPFLMTEAALMKAVAAGGDRQTLHEKLRKYTDIARIESAADWQENLLALIKADPAFANVAEGLERLNDPKALSGRAEEQVVEFLNGVVEPLLERSENLPKVSEQLRV